MRHRDLRLNGVSRWRYRELLAYCRQYPEWKRSAAAYLSPRAPRLREAPGGGMPASDVEYAVEKREEYLRKVQGIEECAREADPHMWRGILRNVCYGQGFEQVRSSALCGNRNRFFAARRRFFQLLDGRL